MILKILLRHRYLAEKQLLWCMLADLYLAHYQNNSYVIDHVRIEGLPQDINTWTQNNIKKITDILGKSWRIRQSVKHGYPDLKTLISVEDSALIYTPTLFDFIVEKISGLPSFFMTMILFNPCIDNGLIFEKNNRMMH